MLRGGVIVLVAIFSVTILKRKLYGHNFLGIFLVIIGVTMVGLSAILNNSGDDSNSSNQGLGVALIAGSLIF